MSCRVPAVAMVLVALLCTPIPVAAVTTPVAAVPAASAMVAAADAGLAAAVAGLQPPDGGEHCVGHNDCGTAQPVRLKCRVQWTVSGVTDVLVLVAEYLQALHTVAAVRHTVPIDTGQQGT
jgi:hypothetical protein